LENYANVVPAAVQTPKLEGGSIAHHAPPLIGRIIALAFGAITPVPVCGYIRANRFALAFLPEFFP